MRGLDELVETGRVTEAEAREALKTVLWRRSEPTTLRNVAYDELLEDSGRRDDTRRMTELLLRTEVVLSQRGDMAARFADEAARQGWTDLLPTLVRSLATPVRGVALEQRAELAAIRTLAPDRSPPAVVWDVFTGDLLGTDGDELGDKERLAAWSLLMQLDGGRAYALERAAEFHRPDAPSIAGGDALAAIVRAARELRVVPTTAEELAWLRRLAEPANAAFWRDAARAATAFADPAGRAPSPQDGLELRHLAALVYAQRFQPQALEWSRSNLLSTIETELAGRDHRWRDRDTAGEIPNESLERNERDMSRADLLLLWAGLEAIDRAGPGARRALGELGDRDMLDTTTEHGGVLSFADDDGALTIAHYPPRPRDRVSDQRMIAPDALLTDSDDALFHFHLHAQRYDNGPLAGPSPGDFDYARLHGRACVVFTFVDRARMNADYYQPNGVVIDLGMIDVRPPRDRAAASPQRAR